MTPAAVRSVLLPDEALEALLDALKAEGFGFVTPTPETHARVVARSDKQIARNLRDILGWSLPFAPSLLAPSLFAMLDTAGMIARSGDGLFRSLVRVSKLGGDLYLHSAHPTSQDDAVFFGPDSYRFADLIAVELEHIPPPGKAHIVDIGTGAGVGAIVAAHACPTARVTMTDINVSALRLAKINANAARVAVTPLLSGDLTGVVGAIDVALANPPYIIDASGRDYRDGGALHGSQVALDMARNALARLAPGGRLILYTGSAIIDGRDPLREALAGLARNAGCTMRYREIDPDMFGEELERSAYVEVERIAVVAAIIARPEIMR